MHAPASDRERAPCAVAVLALVCCGVAACSGTAPMQPTGSAEDSRTALTAALTAQDMKALVARIPESPAALVRLVDARIGVSLAWVVGCEREDAHDVVGHLCGTDADRELHALHQELANRISAPVFGDYPRVECNTAPAPACTVNADGECDTVFNLYFAGTRDQPRLEALVGRDDWQDPTDGQPRVELDRRIADVLAAPRRCP